MTRPEKTPVNGGLSYLNLGSTWMYTLNFPLASPWLKKSCQSGWKGSGVVVMNRKATFFMGPVGFGFTREAFLRRSTSSGGSFGGGRGGGGGGGGRGGEGEGKFMRVSFIMVVGVEMNVEVARSSDNGGGAEGKLTRLPFNVVVEAEMTLEDVGL